MLIGEAVARSTSLATSIITVGLVLVAVVAQAQEPAGTDGSLSQPDQARWVGVFAVSGVFDPVSAPLTAAGECRRSSRSSGHGGVGASSGVWARVC